MTGATERVLRLAEQEGPCPECRGTGGYVTDWEGMESYGEDCSVCHGTGHVAETAKQGGSHDMQTK